MCVVKGCGLRGSDVRETAPGLDAVSRACPLVSIRAPPSAETINEPSGDPLGCGWVRKRTWPDSWALMRK